MKGSDFMEHSYRFRFSNFKEAIIDKRVNAWYNNITENKGAISRHFSILNQESEASL